MTDRRSLNLQPDALQLLRRLDAMQRVKPTEDDNSRPSTSKRIVTSLKKCLRENSEAEYQRRRSQAKLTPLPDKKIRRATSGLKRTPTNELEKLRRKGDDWTANDLFRFQYSDPEEGQPEERRILCFEWLERLQKIQKKFCYLAWYAAAIHACYYRLAPLLRDAEEKKRIFEDVKREYAEIFLMGRRIWRRPTHPSRLRVFYDLAVLCTRFGDVPDDLTIAQFRHELADQDNFDFKVLSEIQFANSIDKVVRLENFVIDQFYARRRSIGSRCSSARSRSFRSDASPNRDISDDSRRPSECESKESRMSQARDRVRSRAQLTRTKSDETGAQPRKSSFEGQHLLKPDRPSVADSSNEALSEIVDHQESEEMQEDTLPDEFVMLSTELTNMDAPESEQAETERPKSILVPTIVVEGPEGFVRKPSSTRRNSQARSVSPKQIVRFEE